MLLLIKKLIYVKRCILQTILPLILIQSSVYSQNKPKSIVDNLSEWNEMTLSLNNSVIMKSNDWGGIIDLMGNGCLMLKKNHSDSLFNRVSDFYKNGSWTSVWRDFGQDVKVNSIKASIIAYGKNIDMRKGWIKFEGNPILSGGNILLPLNPKNITVQTILLPLPGGVPQDQSIVRGHGIWKNKWILFFNHTPNKWPKEYYWSAAIADSLSPLKKGINPFKIDSLHYPLYGPIDNHAPNDWISVDGVTYAPDENYDGDSHMWKSIDMVSWIDMGPISGINGSDPGMIYDGKFYYLFNEDGDFLNYNKLNEDFVNVVEGTFVLNVGGHTGDADLGFFSNQWHMFYDDGPHLNYQIGYASTTAEKFPFGWVKYNKIYGPHNPEQGQIWDDDTKEGNNFGTGDADIALEGNTLYLFTERPIGVAFRELAEVYDNRGLEVRALLEVDRDSDGLADDSTGWLPLNFGNSILTWPKHIQGRCFRLTFNLISENPVESPLIQSFQLMLEKSEQ